MMSEQEIFEKVDEAVRGVLNLEPGQLQMNSLFQADLGAESIDFLDISYEIEQRTGVELDFTEALDYIADQKGGGVTDVSVKDVVDYLIHVLKSREESTE